MMISKAKQHPRNSTLQPMEHISHEQLCRIYCKEALAIVNPLYGYFKITAKEIEKLIPLCFSTDSLYLGCVIRGEIDIDMNKDPYHMSKGTTIYEFGGSVIEIKSVSKDFEMLLITTNEEIKLQVLAETNSSTHKNTYQNAVTILNKTQQRIFISSMDLLKNVTMDHALCFQIASGVCVFLVNLFKHLADKQKKIAGRNVSNYQLQIFQKFQELVKANCLIERSVSFYADKLCITQRSLGSIIKEYGGCCAKEWIDNAVITEAKILLAYSTKNIMQISEEMNFNTLATFTIFFKRMTDQTPLEYRKYACTISNGSIQLT